ncbi:hypothetical protein CBL_02834 [Carabus blaptoides fortunei]
MSSDLNMERLLADEYELQHFGFSSSDFIAQFRSAIINTIRSVHEDMEKCIVSKLTLNDEQKQVLHSEIINLQQQYIDILTESLKKSEQDIRSFFAIPKHVILDSDKIYLEVSEEDLSKLTSEIEALETEYLKEKTLIALYKQELDIFTKIEPLQQQLTELFRKIDKLPDTLEEIALIDKLSKTFSRIMDQFAKHDVDKLKNGYKFKTTSVSTAISG